MPTLQGSFVGLDPYELPVVRHLAERTGAPMGDNPSAANIQELFGVWGTKAAFAQNAPTLAQTLQLDGSKIPDLEVLDMLEETGTLDGFDIRNLQSFVEPKGSLVAIATGATVRWMEYRVKQIVDLANRGFAIDKVYAVASDERRCSEDSELEHPVVESLISGGELPWEYEVLEKLLREAQFPAEFVTGKSLEVNVATLMARHPELAHARIYVPTNGNATYIPLAVRRFIRKAEPSFDGGYDQFWLSQKGIPLARTPQQAADTRFYQRPLTVFSGLIRLMSELYLLPTS